MILIKEITPQNCGQFAGMPADILVTEHKKGEMKMKHWFYLIGVVVCQFDSVPKKKFYVQFTNGSVSGIYGTVFELIEKESPYFSFYYIEIKKKP